MRAAFMALLLLAVVVFSAVGAAAEDKKVEFKDTTLEWMTLYDRGVSTGKRLNANCKSSDYVDAAMLGETFRVCKKFKAFYNSPQFSKSPDAFQLGFLSTIK